MIRTQIYLTEQQKKKIERAAIQEGRPEAEIFRDVVKLGLWARTYRDTSGLVALRKLIDKNKELKERLTPVKIKAKTIPGVEIPKKRRGRPRKVIAEGEVGEQILTSHIEPFKKEE